MCPGSTGATELLQTCRYPGGRRPMLLSPGCRHGVGGGAWEEPGHHHVRDGAGLSSPWHFFHRWARLSTTMLLSGWHEATRGLSRGLCQRRREGHWEEQGQSGAGTGLR